MFKNLFNLLLLSSFIFGCSEITPEYRHLQKTKPKFTGKIIGYNPDVSAQITMVLPSANQQKTTPIDIDENGRFELELEYPLKYQQGWFGVGEEHIDGSSKKSYWTGLIINEGLHIEIDFSQDSLKGYYNADFIQLSGPDAELNKYIQEYCSHKWESNRSDYQDPNPIIMRFNTPAIENHDTLLAVHNHNYIQDSIYISSHASPFSKLITEERESSSLGLINLLNWKGEIPIEIEQKIHNHKPTLLTNSSIIDFYNYQAQRFKGDIWRNGKAKIKALRNQISDNTDQDRYSYFINELEKKYDKQPYDTITIKNDLGHYSEIYKNEILLEESKAYLDTIQQFDKERADILNLIGGHEDIWRQKIYSSVAIDKFNIEGYREIAKSEWEQTSSEIEEINSLLSNIQISDKASKLGDVIEKNEFGASMIESPISSVDTLLTVLKIQFKGKHLVLDIWATWCGPCLADMKNSIPNLTKLEERDIEVIYLCSATSRSTDKWRKRITETKSPKTHIYMTPDLSKEIMATFKLMGYPSHVFIDKNGKYHEDVIKWIEHIDFNQLDEKLSQLQ